MSNKRHFECFGRDKDIMDRCVRFLGFGNF